MHSKDHTDYTSAGEKRADTHFSNTSKNQPYKHMGTSRKRRERELIHLIKAGQLPNLSWKFTRQLVVIEVPVTNAGTAEYK